MSSDQKSVKMRSDYADIIVKVDKDEYHLDRLQLALKSDYFEKLFIEDFHERRCDLIELFVMDSDIFSLVVDVMYGKDLRTVITVENCVSLLMTIDYLQMKIDLQLYANFIKQNAKELSDSTVLKLYNFVSQNQNFKALLPSIFEYLCSHLNRVRGYDEFLSIPLERFIKIILVKYISENIKSMREFCEICVDWICYDLENRLPHVFKLVNAVKYSESEDSESEGSESEGSEFEDSEFEDSESEDSYDDSHDENMKNKLARFLEKGHFYDITVKVEDKTYRLHRFKLKSMCGYFAKLFSVEISAEGTAETPIHVNKDMEYSLAGIDHTTFEIIINYMYLEQSVDLLTSNNIVSALNAGRILQIEGFDLECESWMTRNIDKINAELAAEIFNFTCGNVNFEKFHKLYFRKVVPLTWPVMGDNVSLFRSVSFDMLEEILLSETLPSFASPRSAHKFCIDDQYKMLDICSKWIIHDVKNRYHLIPRIALAINCNYIVDYDDYKVETPANFNNCSEQDVRDELLKILNSTSLVLSNVSTKNARRKFLKKPVFIVRSPEETRILNPEFNNIGSLLFRNSEHYLYCESVSAASINDNVFILTQIYLDYEISERCVLFQVYNLSLRKFTSLSHIPICMPERSNSGHLTYKLFNCCNEIYCCYGSGSVLKYSIQLNRWTRLSKFSSDKRDVKFASDGRKLYRMYKTSTSGTEDLQSEAKYVVDIYDFKQKVWLPLPNLPLRTNLNYFPTGLTFINVFTDVVVRFE
ncbi:hypothetical protein U1Q18_050468 [Sarracenia purpurea var. burkii]